MLEILGIIFGVAMAVIGGIWAVFKVFLPKLMDAAILPIRLTHTPTRDRFCVYNG